MADDDKIGLDLLSEFANFFGGLSSHHLGHRIEAQLFQSGNAFIEDLREIVFYPNRCSSEGYLGQQKSTVIGEQITRDVVPSWKRWKAMNKLRIGLAVGCLVLAS